MNIALGQLHATPQLPKQLALDGPAGDVVDGPDDRVAGTGHLVRLGLRVYPVAPLLVLEPALTQPETFLCQVTLDCGSHGAQHRDVGLSLHDDRGPPGAVRRRPLDVHEPHAAAVHQADQDVQVRRPLQAGPQVPQVVVVRVQRVEISHRRILAPEAGERALSVRG